MSSPRLAPWLVPETIRSGRPPSRPSSAKRTQSTGVPSVAKPLWPSPNSTSSTLSGERVVMLRAVALRLAFGAITSIVDVVELLQRPPGRLQAGSGDAVVVGEEDAHAVDSRGPLVGDRLQVEAVWRRRFPGLRARRAGEQASEALDAAAARGDLEHRPDQDPDHAAHEGVGGDPEAEHVAGLLRPGGGEDQPLEMDVIGLGRGEGGEVVAAEQRRRAGVEALAVDPVRPPQRPAALERAGRAAGQQPVVVAARDRVAAGVEALGGRCGGGDREVARADAVEPPQQVTWDLRGRS